MRQPAFDGLIGFERTPQQSGQTFILKHRNTTLIQYENAARNAFEVTAQAGFTPAKGLLCFSQSAQLLACT